MTGRLERVIRLGVALAAIISDFAGAQSPPVQPSRVAVSGACEGQELALEARAAPGTRVIIAVATARAHDGKFLDAGDPLLIASTAEPSLRGVTGHDGVFRIRIPLDAAMLDHLPPVLFAQAARLLANDAGHADHSDVVSITIPRSARKPALLWALAALATLTVLFFLPAAIRAGLARTVAVVTLVALPFLLARGYGSLLTHAPYLPFEGDLDAALAGRLGPEAVSELHALNAMLPESQPVVVLLPLDVGPDLLLRRLFAKRPYATAPSLAMIDGFAKRLSSSAVVVCFDHFQPADAQAVFEAKSFRAWRR